ncbi:MAG: hypothetical protein GWO02_09395 [Gammaproteobacteria bacterium]|nr:hypothetical protein [Gammaproteobacteria bacterium]
MTVYMDASIEADLRLLAERARLERIPVDAALTAALARLEGWLERLAAELRVEHYGPGVGVEGQPQAYRLVVRRHAWDATRQAWGLKICDGTAYGEWRPMWTLQGAGRRRKAALVRALPELLAGYARAVEAAGRGDGAAAEAVRTAARILSTG